ncbi:hypothetical protein DSECCO2_483320 [anaerobic digester metagenome]
MSTEGAEQEFEHRKVREKRISTISAGAGGVVGGGVAVIVRVLGGGEADHRQGQSKECREMMTSQSAHISDRIM